MRHLCAAAAIALSTLVPASAQQPPEEPGLLDRGLGGLMDRFLGQETPSAPEIANDLTGALRALGPVLQDLAAQVDNIRHYQAPERLPNGDIVIRRKDTAPPPPDKAPDPAQSIPL